VTLQPPDSNPSLLPKSDSVTLDGPQIIEGPNIFEDIEMELEESQRNNDTDIKIAEKL